MGPIPLLRSTGLAAFSLAFAACTPDGLPTRPLPDGGGGGAGDGGTDDPWGTEDTGETDGGTADGGTTDGGTEPDDALRLVVKPDYLNLHEGPSNDDPVIRALGCGSEVTVTGDADGNWQPVTGAGEDGWVKKAWLARPDEAGDDPCPGPDPYLDDTPGRVEDLLSVTPYVEQDCRDTSLEGWPFEAQRCTYNGGLVVKVANPSAEQVTAWIADASQLIPALWALEERDRDAWKDGLEIIASHTLYQSSRIFPLEGEVDEGYVYDFSRGVTEGCSSGCYCRINSLTRQQWCEYADKELGLEDEEDCLDEYSTTEWTEAWADHCLDAHRAAWTGVHHGYRAMAWWANQTIEDSFPDPETADPDEVIDLLDALY
ncbi:SH3 domain-containing protein [Myxococcota bacterium]|nr:SH3 domain-containing protein [Myxococcota bacterium]